MRHAYGAVYKCRSDEDAGITENNKGIKMTTKEEIHDALCPALTGGKCACTESPVTVDKAWSKFCGGIGRGPDAPYPGMIEAFETHYGQSFTDRDWRNEASTWAAAWGYAIRHAKESK